MLITPLWNDSHGPILWWQEHKGLLEPSTIGWDTMSILQGLGKNTRGPHAAFTTCSSQDLCELCGALGWAHTVENSPAVALGLRFAFSVTLENMGFSHFPCRPAKIITAPTPSWFFLENTQRTTSAASLGSIKWQNFVFKGHWHLRLKRNLDF